MKAPYSFGFGKTTLRFYVYRPQYSVGICFDTEKASIWALGPSREEVSGTKFTLVSECFSGFVKAGLITAPLVTIMEASSP